jgi:hypothetical protein
MHTMDGFLHGTDQLFKRNGYTGAESTFGIGGPFDGAVLDGAVWQWQELDHEADAQVAGNPYATSVETSDGAKPLTPWSTRQVASIIELMVWWLKQTGNPPVLVRRPTDRGIGYHSQFAEWNPHHHDCPGAIRTGQLLRTIIPTVQRALIPGDTVNLTDADVTKIWDKFLGSTGPEADLALQHTYNVVDTLPARLTTIEAKLDQIIANQPSLLSPKGP